MKSIFTFLLWLAIFAIGAHLRLDDLASRPFHADEATGAKITSMRLESGTYVFDPLHYHGPILSELGELSALAAGEKSWSELNKQPLRLVPAIAGCLLVLLPLLGVRRFGQPPMLLAALALATSPLLVYYSRMYIHEMLLALFGVLALFQLAARKCWWPAGVWIGLMFATKETFATSLIAWFAAAVLTFFLVHDRPSIKAALLFIWKPLTLIGSIALAVSMFHYTDHFTRWSGAIDAFRTYFVYKTVEGHDKPFFYYLTPLIFPKNAGGLWWFETPLILAALAAFIASFVSKSMSRETQTTIRFLAFAAAFHFLIYSLIAYKTPWLVLLPWAHVCLLAGFAVFLIPNKKPLLAGAIALAFIPLWFQSRNATGRYASDDRNPYAYVPTAGDIETLEPWLDSIAAASPDTPMEPVAIIGSEYWPLPWYLRKYPKMGAWPEAPPSLERLPVIFAMNDLTDTLIATHVPVPRGLRTDTPMVVWIRHDFWDASVKKPDASSPE
ncbi:flippase activity-associated protein Agl23 [Haloferula chungangensis]|uniref:Flippase activity-associated protein Agl23 n=1 Tax=Haloferula chungangensis TaxID=1048331 RepID=A0ABW2L8A0_9BACT